MCMNLKINIVSACNLLAMRKLALNFVLNTSAFIVKFIGAILSGSLALLADAVDSIVNVVSSGATYFLVKASRAPPDEKHPYGHFRYEVVASIITLVLVVSASTLLMHEAVSRFLAGALVRLPAFTVYFAAASLAVNLLSMAILHSYIREFESVAVSAELKHVGLDLVESLAVLVGVYIAAHYFAAADLLAALLVISYAIYALAGILRDIIEGIMDVSDVEVAKRIKEIAEAKEEVVECHGIRLRKVGPVYFADIHVVVSGSMSVLDAHRIAHEIEAAIKRALPKVHDVVVHIEPAEEEVKGAVERIYHGGAVMPQVKTHRLASPRLVGRPIEVRDGEYAVAELQTTKEMAVDEKGLVHGGFTFGLADYAAMLAVNHPNVVLAEASVKFTKPVKVGDVLRAEAKVAEKSGNKYIVEVKVTRSFDNAVVLEGRMTCVVPNRHVLEREGRA